MSRDLDGLGIEKGWTESRRRDWWAAHAPGGRAEGSAPTAEIDLSRDATRSSPDRALRALG